MVQPPPSLSVDAVGEIVRNAVAPVFLLSGIGAFLNVCASRLSRIVDRSRQVEPRLLESRGTEHDRWVRELHILDRRMSLVSWATFFSVLSALLTCLVVVVLFAATLTNRHYGTAVALLFIAAMLSIGAGFAVFLIETLVASRAVRVRSELLQHQAEESA
jgi:general stress protein CsbA